MLRKKFFSFSAALAMSAVLLTGCFGSSSSSSSSSSVSQSSSSYSSNIASAGSDVMSDAGNVISDATSDVGGAVSDTMSDVGDAVSDITRGKAMSAAAKTAAALQRDKNWALRLVNANNPLPENFEPETANISGYENRPFDMRAADAMEEMLKAAEQAGHPLYLVSGYRSIGRQKALFERKTNVFVEEGFSLEEAKEQAARWVARPGTSEHNLGLAADIVSADWYQHQNDLIEEFDQTPAFTWLIENCANFGFILRYPKGKEYITGVSYEPWHYRYVGVEHAKKIMQEQLTLEEYVGQPAPAA